MPAVSNIFDTLLRLGEQIAKAVEAGEWAQVEDLIERRREATQSLEESEEKAVEVDLSEAEQQEKLEALDEQSERLSKMLHNQRDEIEDELAQIGQMRNAQDSYGPKSVQSGVLPSELSG